MRTRSPWVTVAVLSATVGALDAIGRLIIFHRLGLSSGPVAEAWLGAAALAALVLGAVTLVRPEATGMVICAVFLTLVGDLIAVRAHPHALPGLLPSAPVLAAVAFCVTLVALNDTRALVAHARAIGWAGVVLIGLPLLPLIGEADGGQFLSMHFGTVEVQPGELGRPIVLIGLAGGLAELPFPDGADLSWRSIRPELLPALRIPGVAVVLYVLARDLGPALVLGAATMVVIATATGRMRWLLGTGALLVYALAVAASVSERIDGRVRDVLDPLRTVVPGDFGQAGLAQLGLSWGGWWGTGLGGGVTQRKGAVPLGSSDLAIVTWGTEMGLFGVGIVVALLGGLLWFMTSLTLRLENGFPRLLGAGLIGLLSIQVCWVVGAVLGLLPLSGLATPYVSAGRSAPVAISVIAAVVCGLATSGTRPARIRDGIDPLRSLLLVRGGTVMALVVFCVVAASQIDGKAVDRNRRSDNPLRNLSTLVRGPIISSDGRWLAWTDGSTSLDTVTRQYRAGAASDLVGAMDETTAGTGLEQAWGATLRCAGSGQASTHGPTLRVRGDPARCRPAGLVLSLNARLQERAFAALSYLRAAAAVIDTRDGRVLALVGREQGGPEGLLLGAQTPIAPGSTFKVVTGAAAMTMGVNTTTPWSTTFAVPGGTSIRNAGGAICGGTFDQAFAASCNTSFVRMGLLAGAEAERRTARAFGFGTAPGLSGLLTSPGNAPAPDASPAALAASAIGQDTLLSTPLGMAGVAAAIAGEGRRPLTGLVDAVCTGRAVLSRPAVSRVRATSEPVARRIRAAMLETVRTGTARGLAGLPGGWAAKTGTAELPRLARTGTPAGTAGWIIAFPTTGPGAGRLALAGFVLPDVQQPLRSGSVDGVRLLTALAGPATAAAAKRRGASSCGADSRGG